MAHKHIPNGRGMGATVGERKMIARFGSRPETPRQRRERLAKIRASKKGKD